MRLDLLYLDEGRDEMYAFSCLAEKDGTLGLKNESLNHCLRLCEESGGLRFYSSRNYLLHY